MSHVVRALSPWFGPRVEKLGTAEIVRAAVALADGVDLEAVSMRALAKRPGGGRCRFTVTWLAKLR